VEGHSHRCSSSEPRIKGGGLPEKKRLLVKIRAWFGLDDKEEGGAPRRKKNKSRYGLLGRAGAGSNGTEKDS